MLEGDSSFATKYKTQLQHSGGQERVGGGAGGQEKGAGRRGGAFAQKNAMLFICFVGCGLLATRNPILRGGGGKGGPPTGAGAG